MVCGWLVMCELPIRSVRRGPGPNCTVLGKGLQVHRAAVYYLVALPPAEPRARAPSLAGAGLRKGLKQREEFKLHF